MRTTIFLIFLVSTNIICGQNKDTEIDNRICIKIAPLALLDIYSGMSPRIGIEYKIKNNLALYNEIGTYIPNVNSMINNYGFLTKNEFKIYLNNFKYTTGPYLSAELFYKYQSYGTYDSIKLMSNKYLKNYNVTKNVTCFTLKTGIFGVFDNGFLLDAFIGFGIRNRNISSTLTKDENENIQQERTSDGYSNTNILINKAGVFNVLNFDMGIKIGYRIK